MTGHVSYDDLRIGTVRQVAKLMAAAVVVGTVLLAIDQLDVGK